MQIVMFYHSLLSDWNHGNAHFLRGIVSELLSRGYDVRVYEPKDAWSLENLLAEHGDKPIHQFKAAYPGLESTQYDLKTLDLDEALDDADLVIVHEWNDRNLVQRIGKHRARVGGYRLLFHDTHHRSVSDRSMECVIRKKRVHP
jgi:spore maturation protein CgeB